MPRPPELRGVSFRGNVKLRDGIAVAESVGDNFFPSQSSPNKEYKTTAWSDDTFSCNCRGWVSHGHCRHVETMSANWRFSSSQRARALLTPGSKINARVVIKKQYAALLNVPEGTRGDFAVEHKTFPAGHVFSLTTDRTAVLGGHKSAKVVHDHETRWHTLIEGDGVWMSDYPIEQGQIDREIAAMKTGRVLVGGLGLGYAVTMLAKRSRIKEVVVVEKSSDVIALVAEHLLRDDLVARRKLVIVHADLFAYLRTVGERRGARAAWPFDHAFYDIWTSDSESTFFYTVLPLLRLSHHRVQRTPVSWNESVMRGQLHTNLLSRWAFAHAREYPHPDARKLVEGMPTLDTLSTYGESIWRNWSVPFFQWVKAATPTQKEVEDKATLYASGLGHRTFEDVWKLVTGISFEEQAYPIIEEAGEPA